MRLSNTSQAAMLCGAVLVTGASLAQTPSADGFNPAANNFAGAVALQTDGRILIGGGFTTLSNLSHARLGRVSAEGAVESGFNASADATVYCLAVQRDGKVLVGGDFTSLAGQACRAIGRLNTNGTCDTTFYLHVFDPPPPTTVTARAQAILVLPDGKIIHGGRVSYNGGPIAGYVDRLTTNGFPDNTFPNVSIGGGPVDSLALQDDGKILVGGQFSSVNSQPISRLARLNADGSLDTTFNAGVDPATGSSVLALAVQSDQSILVGGYFSTVAGQPRANLARVDASGLLDPGFNPSVSGGTALVRSLQVQADGKILVGGMFTTLGGVAHSRLGRLLPDGTLDGSFTVNANSDVYGLALQGDGRLLTCGYFTQLAGQPRNYVGRLNTLEPPSQSLSYDGALITWTRYGSSCEIHGVTFESSDDGVTWTALGDATRVPGAWQLGASLPAGTLIRAWGRATGGGYNSSSWVVESIWPPARPAIVTNDAFFGVRSNGFGFNITGTAGATVVVEDSINLTTWTTLWTNVLVSTRMYFSDPGWTNSQNHFYRLRSGL